MRILVIGDGMLGSSIAEEARKKNWTVFQTSRKNHNFIHLDLCAKADISSLPETDWAVLAAGISGFQRCTDDPLSHAVNVENSINLCRDLLDRGSSILFASSTAVFNGNTPFPGPAHPLNPDSEYGRQKAAVEKFLQQCKGKTAIVRYSKLLDRRHGLIAKWIADLEKGLFIKAFADLEPAPVLYREAARASCAVMGAGSSGIFHCSAPEEISYYEFALKLCSAGGFDSSLVQKAGCRDYSDHCPRHSSLDVSETEAALDIKFSSIDRLVTRLIKKHSSEDAE